MIVHKNVNYTKEKGAARQNMMADIKLSKFAIIVSNTAILVSGLFSQGSQTVKDLTHQLVAKHKVATVYRISAVHGQTISTYNRREEFDGFTMELGTYELADTSCIIMPH